MTTTANTSNSDGTTNMNGSADSSASIHPQSHPQPLPPKLNFKWQRLLGSFAVVMASGLFVSDYMQIKRLVPVIHEIANGLEIQESAIESMDTDSEDDTMEGTSSMNNNKNMTRISSRDDTATVTDDANNHSNQTATTSQQQRSSISSISPSPSQPPPPPPPSNNKYLQYVSISGWSNQVQCMEHAYQIAKATQRTLLTAPILPHFFHNGASIKNGGQYSHHYRLDLDLSKQYLRKLHAQDYVKVQDVLDVEYTFRGVSTMDYRDFVQTKYKSSSMKTWIIESTFHRYNTLFTTNAPELEGSTTHDKDGNLQVHHDWTQIAKNYSDYSIWSLLDSFQVQFYSSVKTHAPWNVRFAPPIRQAAREIHKHVWHNLPYASIHLRAGDGHFAKHVRDTINAVTDMAVPQIVQYYNSGANRTDNRNAIGLFVATDMDDAQKAIFAKTIRSKLEADTEFHGNVNDVKFWYSDMFSNYTRRPDLKSLVYPDIFLDQQVAACATIGFTPSARSTFSKLINLLRRSPGACD